MIIRYNRFVWQSRRLKNRWNWHIGSSRVWTTFLFYKSIKRHPTSSRFRVQKPSDSVWLSESERRRPSRTYQPPATTTMTIRAPFWTSCRLRGALEQVCSEEAQQKSASEVRCTLIGGLQGDGQAVHLQCTLTINCIITWKPYVSWQICNGIAFTSTDYQDAQFWYSMPCNL